MTTTPVIASPLPTPADDVATSKAATLPRRRPASPEVDRRRAGEEAPTAGGGGEEEDVALAGGGEGGHPPLHAGKAPARRLPR